MNNTDMITIEALELLADQAESDDAAQRAKLARLITAYARIASAAQPEAFTRRAKHVGDEAGHFDSSFPPSIVHSDRTGPLSIRVTDSETEDVATSTGFYYDWRRVTTRGALAVGPGGGLYRSDESGTGRVGQYAAHPGDCDVDVEITWSRVDVADPEEVTLAELAACEAAMRTLAFPLVAAKLAAGKEGRA